MKAYGGWGGGITPCIINFGTISRWVVSYMPQLLCFEEISPDMHWVGHHVCPRARLYVLCKNICYPYWEANHSSSVVQRAFYLLSWLLLHLPCIFCYSVTEAVLLDTFVCPTTQYQYSYIVCVFSGLQHVCLHSQMLLCRVLLHCVMGTHAKKLYCWPFSEFLMLCGKRICCGWYTWAMQILWNKLTLPLFCPLFYLITWGYQGL